MVFIFQIFLGIGYLPIVGLRSTTLRGQGGMLTGYDFRPGFRIGVKIVAADPCLALAVPRGGESE